jgi:ankyrin repeat protein
LVQAPSHGNTKSVSILLKNGTNVNILDYRFGNPLQTASREGHEAVVELLLDAGADEKVLGGAAYGTALMAAIYRGYKGIITLLVAAGANKTMLELTTEMSYSAGSESCGGDYEFAGKIFPPALCY